MISELFKVLYILFNQKLLSIYIQLLIAEI